MKNLSMIIVLGVLFLGLAAFSLTADASEVYSAPVVAEVQAAPSGAAVTYVRPAPRVVVATPRVYVAVPRPVLAVETRTPVYQIVEQPRPPVVRGVFRDRIVFPRRPSVSVEVR